MVHSRIETAALLAVGICLGAAIHSALSSSGQQAAAQATKPAEAPLDVSAEIAAIKGKLTDQSHVMQDVSYHFGNLWFAGQHENWDLADFYLAETKSHLHWAVRVIPKRKDKAGKEVDLAPILEALENGPLKKLQDTIANKDRPTFEREYRATLEGCYACHKTADKPFLHPQVPERPETPIINFDPHADWPR
jgi:hypothetical protein